MENDILFNCCTNAQAPDWSQYDALVLGGCIMDPEDEGHVIGGIDREQAEFFCIYGRFKEGGCDAITDWHGSFEEAMGIAFELHRISGHPLDIDC